jgi:hypothetical protein
VVAVPVVHHWQTLLVVAVVLVVSLKAVSS